MEDDDDSNDAIFLVDDDDDSNSDSTSLTATYQRLSAESGSRFSMDDDSADESGNDDSLLNYYLDDIYDIEGLEDYEMSDDEDASVSDALSEASTIVNGENQQSSQSGTDTEVDDEDEEQPTEPVAQQSNERYLRQLSDHIEQVQDEIIQSQKKIRLDNSAERKEAGIADDISDEDQRCPICLELWTNAGEHRLCSLRCGHLFGLSCINQWFNVARNSTGRKCPECNTKASRKDIRVLYAKNLRCLDTSEIEKLKNHIKDLSNKKEKAERELTQLKSKEVLFEQQLNSYRQKILDLERKIKSISSGNCILQYENSILKKNKVFDICSTESCRVMAYNPWHKTLVASCSNTISKIYVDSFSSAMNIKVHNGPIRDMAFQEKHSNTMLSVGFDKRVVLTDIRNNFVTHSYILDTNLWSCCWSNYSPQTFFVGGVGGKTVEYDIRNLQSNVSTKVNEKDRSPVVSLASVPVGSPALRAGGYLACQLNSCHAYGFKEGNYVGNNIDIEGPFISLRYNEKDNHVLLSCRGNKSNPFVRQMVCSVEKIDEQIKFNTIHTFNCGSISKCLSRPWCMNLKKETVVIANDDNQKSILAWSISSGKQVFKLPISESVVDICSFENGDIYQALLTSNRLHLYSYQDESV